MTSAVELDPVQQEAVASDAAPLCILAAAGSGKTRVLTHRIAHRIRTGAADARHVLALTFTRKAAGELRSRLRTLGVENAVTAGTFHAVAWAQVREHAAEHGRPHPTLLAAPGRVVGRLLPNADAATVAGVVGEIAWARARLVTPARYEEAAAAASRTASLPPAALAAVYEAYEEEKRRRRLLDFDDMLAACADAIEAGGRFGEAQRWRFRHFFVDEFQDVNPLQFRLLRAWLGDRLDLTVVGDPNQAVYAWNGSDPELLHRFPEHFPTAGVVRLETGYRCPPEVLAVAAAALGRGERESGASPPRPPRHGDRPSGGLPTVRAFHTDIAEARGIAQGLRRAHRPGTPWSDLAVLVRTNAQREAVERALRATGVPHRRQGDDFRRAAEVRDALGVLRRTPPAVPFTAALRDLDELVDAAPPEGRVHLATLQELAREYAGVDRSPTGTGFADWLNLVVRGDEPGDGDGVTVTTFHRAKGLEWPVVFVAGVERGFVPIAHADTPQAEAEERRLLYVALTRATREVHVSWAEQRTMGGRRIDRAPSPWLAAVERTCARLAAARQRASVDWRTHVAAGRARLADSGRCDTHAAGDVVAALRSWRATAARAARVPATVIVPDRVLVAVAEARPRTRDELAAVPGVGRVKAAAYGDAVLAVLDGAGVASAPS